MPEPTHPPPVSSRSFSLLLLPIIAAVVLLYRLDSFEPAALLVHEFADSPASVPLQYNRLLQGVERIGVDQLLAPEDLVYDSKSGVIYATCVDGWLKRVTVNDSASDSVIEDWVNTGGRPLGIVLGHNSDVIVADSDKGLLRVTKAGNIELLTKEAEGAEFKLIDGVDVTDDGTIYFTDASTKYNLKDHIWDILEGSPYGRLLSYNPSTKHTQVLVRDLYFANGVAVSPDQQSVVFCETPMRRCQRYYIEGPKKGSLEKFAPNLPGMPDNIRYDGEGGYLIGLASGVTYVWDLAQRYPFIRKVTGILERYGWRPSMEKNGGVLFVDVEGNSKALYNDPGASLITGGIKIGDYLYIGSIKNSYIMRLNLAQHPAIAA